MNRSVWAAPGSQLLPESPRVCVCALVGDCTGEATGRELHVGMGLVRVVPYSMSWAWDSACHIEGTHLLHTTCMNTAGIVERTQACVGTSRVCVRGQRQTGTHRSWGAHGCTRVYRHSLATLCTIVFAVPCRVPGASRV